MSNYTIEAKAQEIAEAALANMNVNIMLGRDADPETALNTVCAMFIKEANDADARQGRFARETTREEIAEVGFRAAVAIDIMDGAIVRPSVGNVRRYTLKAMAGEL